IAEIVSSRGKPCKPEATTIVISVNDRSERDTTKRYKELEVDWLVVEKQMQSWSNLFRAGKILRIHALFNYKE
ncbi:hypothetical protein IQ07DRAFT_463994, partial [Pyrenochaeta sp. DS3sAY3a]